MSDSSQSVAQRSLAQRMRRRRRILLVSLALAWGACIFTATTVLAAPLAQETDAQAKLWPVLLPLLAASIAIERTVEVFWNYIDWILLNFRGWEPVQIKSTEYMQFKSGTSLVLGIVLGILISNYTGMRLFDYLRPLTPNFLENVPPVWDVIITGAILGAGSKPMHDLLGIITQTKNLLGNNAIRSREEAGAAIAEGVLKLAQSDAQAMIDVPGVGPARLATPGQVEGAEGEGEADAASITNRYIDTLHNRTVF